MIVLGRVTAPFGVRGWIRIHPFGDDPLAWRQMPQLWIGADGEWRALELRGLEPHGKDLVAALGGIEDRDAAEQLRGRYVGAPREALPPTNEDEYYWSDLIGLQVVDAHGKTLGRVSELITSGAHEVLCVEDAAGVRRMLPFVAAVVRQVDTADGTIRVDWDAEW